MIYRRIFIIGTIATILSSCGHNLYFASRTSGATAKGKIVTVPGHPSGDVSIVLHNKTYTGRWVYMSNGGMVGIGTSNIISGTQSATATSTIVGAPLQGNGSILLSAQDGSTLRCGYDYSEWNSSGVGVCQDNKGEVYDLQIN